MSIQPTKASDYRPIITESAHPTATAVADSAKPDRGAFFSTRSESSGSLEGSVKTGRNKLLTRSLSNLRHPTQISRDRLVASHADSQTSNHGAMGPLQLSNLSTKTGSEFSGPRESQTERNKSLTNRSSSHSAQTEPGDQTTRKRSLSHRAHNTQILTSKTDAIIPSSIIRVPLMTFINFIDIPVISHKVWTVRVVESFLIGASRPGSLVDRLPSIMNEVKGNLLEHSSILHRIKQAVELLGGVTEHGFLKTFLAETNAIRFYRRYNTLKSYDHVNSEFLYKVIGGVQALKILKSLGDSDVGGIHKQLQSQFDIVLSAEKKKALLLNSSFEFQTDFDIEHLDVMTVPICLFNCYEFTESWRAFYSDGPFQDGVIRVNGENLTIPNYLKLGIKDEDRAVYFQKWLIRELQQKMMVFSFLSEADQIEIFAEKLQFKGNVKKLNHLIVNGLGKYFNDGSTEEPISKKIKFFLESLKLKKNSQEFADQMLPYCDLIGKYLIKHQGFRERDWNGVSGALINLCSRCYHLKKKQDSIPLLSLLQAMCYSGYASGEILLRKTLCPDLFGVDSKSCRLVLNRNHITAFDISFDNGFFVVKHVKSFRIIEDDTIKVTNAIHWIVKGRLGSMQYAAALEIPEFAFAHNCPSEERLPIVNQFHLDCENSPWGPDLKRVEKVIVK